jgi:hypothetical protein
MRPIDFANSNTVFGKEIPANVVKGHNMVLTRWGMTWRERLSILWHGKVWLAVKGQNMPVVLLSGDQAFEIENP